ncbi:unannotated protein [freshwater metagenome]|uniref:Unannotated protein n=1 Tax=freshwater metagenome TaxID=449393 RepID=A0A6J7HH60_9ZZZZ|nr:hypothetical protein [Actinomycetota bacterium]MSZ42102.1 hypothetical protein [Actinomycetota bacterium]
MAGTTSNDFVNSGFFWALIVLIIWSFVWKAFALYRAGANRSPVWFVVLLVVNTVGILDILYLFIWGKKKNAPAVTVVGQ